MGLALGVLVGRQFRRTRRIYVDAASTKKDQKALTKAQKKSGGNSIGGALLATAATLGFKILQERVLVPRLEEFADRMMSQQGTAEGGKTVTTVTAKPRSCCTTAPRIS